MVKLKFEKQDYQLSPRDEADRSVIGEIFKFREYRAVEKLLSSITEPIVDVGAHAGFFTLYARNFNLVSPIFAIEPEQGNVKLMEKHLAQNDIEGVIIERAALAAVSGKRSLLVSADSHNHRLANFPQPTFSGRRSLTEATVGAPAVVVQALSLADFCDKRKLKIIGLMKMDIEGGEYELLESWTDDDFKRIKNLIMEYHDLPTKKHKALEKILRKQGFGVQVFPSKFDSKMGFILANNK